MGRKAMKSITMDDRKRQNWIQELTGFGIAEGPNGESLQSLSTYDLRGLILKEHLKRD